MNLDFLLDQVTTLLRTELQDFCQKEEIGELNHELSVKIIKRTKALISQVGCMTIEHFFESYDSYAPTIEEDGNLYRLKYKSGRDFLTSVGKIHIKRNVYQQDNGGKSIVPLDRYWKMEHEYISHEVQEGLLYACAHNTPEETSKLFGKISLFKVHPSTIKRMVEKTGNFIEEFKEQIVMGIHKEEVIEESPDILVCSLDGVNVLLNEKGVKKGRKTERPVSEKKTESNSAYKNAMCGTVSVYSIEKEEGKNKPVRTMTKYVSRMPQERYTIFKKEFQNEIAHFESFQPQKKILLTDAHTSIQGYIGNTAQFNDFDWMIDFYHASEHLSKLAELIFGKKNKQGQAWYLKKNEDLKNHKYGVVKVIRSAEYYIKTLLTNNKAKLANKELNYFKRHRKFMNYKLHLDNGWPIGSGVVEAACKSVVKQRMCRSGQRWTRPGGQKILNLRSIVKSERWDSFWNKYSEIKYTNCA